MKPSTSPGVRSNVGIAKPSPAVRQTGNMRCLLVMGRVYRSSVPSGGTQVKYRCRCRDIQARGWIMIITEVDPNNFPRALIAFAGLLFVPFWLVITTGLGMIVLVVSLAVMWGIANIWAF